MKKYFYSNYLSNMKTINFKWKEGKSEFEKSLEQIYVINKKLYEEKGDSCHLFISKTD